MSECSENPEKKAKRLGMRLVRPAENELFIDLDSAEARERFEDLFAVFMTAFGDWDSRYHIEASKSPGHFHCTVSLGRPVKDATERVLLQLALGSDQKRELLALVQIDRGLGADSTVFFEPVRLLTANPDRDRDDDDGETYADPRDEQEERLRA